MMMTCFSYNQSLVAATESACEPHEPHFLESVEMYYDRAAKLSNVSAGTLGHIRAVDSVLSVTFPIQLDDGSTEVINGNHHYTRNICVCV